jgi:arylformamidase
VRYFSWGVGNYLPTERESTDEAYVAAAAARGCPVRFVTMPGTNHYDIVFGLANRESPLANAVLETMGLL